MTNLFHRLWRSGEGRPRLRAVLLAAGVIGLVMAPFGVAATGDVLRLGKRNTAGSETKIVSTTPATSASTGGYATRQSNTSNSGGGAIYGCRSGAGGTAANPPQEPCLRANNLRTGYAFEFAARDSEAAGTITVGSGGDTKKPFTTNATGVATGLNADRVDGKSADEIVASVPKERWLLLDANGQIAEQSGGFTVIDAYGGDGRVYIGAGSALDGHGLTASLADPTTSGEVSVARCGTPAFECAPVGARNASSLVITPRDSDGSLTTADAGRKKVYVTVTP
jgi:hypothetical protein